MPPPAPRVAPPTRAPRPASGLSASGCPRRRPFVLVPPDRAARAGADQIHALVAVDVGADAAVHPLVVYLPVNPLARCAIGERVEHVNAAGWRIRIALSRIAVVVRDDVVPA